MESYLEASEWRLVYTLSVVVVQRLNEGPLGDSVLDEDVIFACLASDRVEINWDDAVGKRIGAVWNRMNINDGTNENPLFFLYILA